MTDSEKIDLLTEEIARLKKAAHEQLVDSFKIMSLLRVLIKHAGFDEDRIHEMMVNDHRTASYVVAEKLGYKPALPGENA